MAKIMILGFTILIAALLTEYIYFNSAHGFYAIAGAFIYLYLFGSYTKNMFSNIDRDFPKDELSN